MSLRSGGSRGRRRGGGRRLVVPAGRTSRVPQLRGPRWWRNLSPRRRLVIRIVVAVGALLCALLGAMVAYAALTLPNIDDIGKATGTIKVLDRNGALIAEFGTGDQHSRTTVPLSQISQKLQDATIATEDRSFYSEGAFNVGRVLKALFVDTIARRPEQGASTITQQLAKLAFLSDNGQATAAKTPLRKIREALLANEIDSRFSKQEILEKYLNLIYYGHGAYGIENASEVYFGKHAKDLDLAEASLLAGLPQAPSAYDPDVNQQAALARQHDVLRGMVDAGKATEAEVDAVDPLVGGNDAAHAAQRTHNQQVILDGLKNGQPQVALSGPAPHFVQYVREQLHELFPDDPAIASTSITVTTTLDLGTQAQAQAAVRAGVDQLAARGANNGALLMMDPATGDIIAMVGSYDFSNSTIAGQVNVTTAQRRPGSSFKPYVYEQAFRSGKLRPSSILHDTPAMGRRFGTSDFDGNFEGDITATAALLHSRNIPAEEAISIAGVQPTIDFVHSLGVSGDFPDNASIAIGTGSVRMIEHAAGYAAFANGGTKVTPRAITKVVDINGNTLYEDHGSGQGTVMSAAQAYSVTKILRGYAGYWHLGFNRPTAGKSGTTDSFVDAWYMAYAPNFVVATWAGHTEESHPGEIGMDQVYGTEVGSAITVPFVNGLKLARQNFHEVSGALSDCSSVDASAAADSGCPTPTPTPTPSASPSPSPSESPTPPPTPTEALPPISLGIGGSPTPSPAPTPTPSPSAGAAAAPEAPTPSPP